MSGLFPEPNYTQPGIVNRSLGTLATGNPAAKGDAIGKVPEYACVAIEVSAACTITIFTWSPMTQTWLNPGSATASYQKTFTAAGWDYFILPPQTLFALKSDTGSIKAYTDAPAAPSN